MKHSKLVRMWKILSLAFVIFIQVYWYKIRKKPKADWEKLWENAGNRFRVTLFELEGLLIKVGQLLSIRGDLLPGGFIKQIQDLADQVPPSQWHEIEQILAQEWGGPIKEKVAAVEQKAVASASIGEVYQGMLHDGTKVAIKVQRPNIRSIVQTDFRTLSIIIWFADHFVPVPKGFINFRVLFQELKQVIERELDFEKELETSLYFQERFKGMEDVKVPKVYPELSTSRVLVMEWVEGMKITEKEGIEKLQLNRKELAQRLVKVFLPQWLEPGIFHADPHAGNVLVDREGRIVLLDFGMAGEISKKDAAYFQELIEGLLAKNYSKAVSAFMNLGFLQPDAETKTIEKLMAELMAFDLSKVKEMDLFKVKKEMNDIVRTLPIQVPTRFVFLGRSFVTIEGMLQILAPGEDLMELFKPEFMGWLNKQEGGKWRLIWQWLSSQPLFQAIHSVNEFLKTPERIEQLKELEQRRQFRFTLYENQKNRWFQGVILGAAGTLAGLAIHQALVWQAAAGAGIISAVGFLICSGRQKKWMKYMPENKRF